MEYLHSQQVVHFDLKCENLLCDLRDLERPVVKIGDLGLSKQKKERYITGNMRGETCCSRAGRVGRWAGGGGSGLADILFSLLPFDHTRRHHPIHGT